MHEQADEEKLGRTPQTWQILSGEAQTRLEIPMGKRMP